MMKHALFLLFCALLPALACTQSTTSPFPNNFNKIRLGYATSGAGLVHTTDSLPGYTPVDRNAPVLHMDSTAGVLYFWKGGVWNAITGADGNGMFSVGNNGDTVRINVAVIPNGAGFALRDVTNDVVFAINDNSVTATAGDASMQAVKSLGYLLLQGDSLVIQVNGSTGTAGQVLTASGDGGAFWEDPTGGGGSGTVTSVAAGVGLTASPSPIITTGTISADTLVLASKTFVTTRGYLTSEVDGSVSNEGSLTVGAGTATTSVINSNTSGSTGVTIEVAGTGLAISESGNTITLTGSGGGTVTGSGTPGTIPVWSSGTALGDSPLTVSSGNVTATGTGAFRLPNGTTAQRPGTPTAGMSRYNTSLGYSETYGASAWLQSAFPVGTSGQTLRHDGTSWVASSVLTNNGTDVINTGAHRATTYASTTGSCAQPAGGHFQSTGGTGAIEITLPVFDVTAFLIKFQVVVGSLTLKNQTFDISMYAQYGGSPTVFFQTDQHVIGGARRFTRNIRYGHDGTNIKVWIDELDTSWGSMTVQVVNVSYTCVSGNYPSAIDICKGWTITLENSAFNTVNQTRAFSFQPARIAGVVDAVGNLDHFQDVVPMLGGAYLGTFTGAIQVNLPDSALITHASAAPVLVFELSIASESVAALRKVRVVAQYSYSSRSWIACFISHVDGAFKNLTFRFGRESTVPVVYIGELATSWHGVNITIHGLETYNLARVMHDGLVTNTWGATTETSAFSNVTKTITGVTSGAIPYTTYGGYQYSENLIWDNTNTRIGVGNNAPARTLHVTGEARITDLTTDDPTRIVGADADGDLGAITVSTGLSLSSGNLTASNLYNANGTLTGARTVTLGSNTLTFSGTAGAPAGVNFSMTPSTNTIAMQSLDGSLNNSTFTVAPASTRILVTNITGGSTTNTFEVFADSVKVSPSSINENNSLTRLLAINASTGRLQYVTKSTIGLSDPGSNGILARTSSGTTTARTITAGSGIAISNGDGVSGNPTISQTYSLTHITISGGSTTFNTTAERPDNDTPGTQTTSTVGSDFSVSGSTLDYTGANGALIRVEGSISFSVSDNTDVYVSIYKEGAELSATSTRLTCTAGDYYTIPIPATTTASNTNDTYEVRIATVTGTTTSTVHRYGFILERIY